MTTSCSAHARAFGMFLLLGACIGSVEGPQPPTQPDEGGAAGGGAGSRPGAAGAPPAGGGAQAGSSGGVAGAGPATPDGAEIEPPADLPALTCAPDAPAPPARLWRLSPRQYVRTVAVLLGGRKPAAQLKPPAWLVAPFEEGDGQQRFSNYASSFTMTDLELRRAVLTAGEVARALVTALRADSKSCLGAGAAAKPFAECAGALIDDRGPRLFQRPLTADERAAYAAVATRALPTVGEDEAIMLAFEQMLVAPAFLFRREVGAGSPDARGRVRLTAYEIAASLALTLTDAPPDDVLWKAAVDGQLATADQVRAQVSRLIGTFSSASATTLRFLREYFRYDGVMQVFKDLGGYAPADLLKDADAMMADLITSNGQMGLLATLLSTDVGFHSHWTSKHWGIGGSTPYVPTKIAMPAAERAGILTNPAFLIAFSDATTNHPVQRGRFVMESLLCRPVPDLPIGVIPALPDDPTMTMRERLALHTKDASCAACHKEMDPFGLAFETFDHLGRFRTMDGTKSVDASGAIKNLDGKDAPFANAADLSRKLAASRDVEVCFLRHSFRYWMGRNEQASDACAVSDAVAAYRGAGGDYRAAIAALLSSDAALYRTIGVE